MNNTPGNCDNSKKKLHDRYLKYNIELSYEQNL